MITIRPSAAPARALDPGAARARALDTVAAPARAIETSAAPARTPETRAAPAIEAAAAPARADGTRVAAMRADGTPAPARVGGAGRPADAAPATLAVAPRGFGYLLPEAAAAPDTPGMARALERLAAAMSAPGLAAPGLAIPPILTCFARFIEHDIAAMGDAGDRAGPGAPRDRATVLGDLANARVGALRLDSLYGGAAEGCGLRARVAAALRHGPRMRLGRVSDRDNRPVGAALDLPRFGALMDDGALRLGDAEVLALLGLDHLGPRALRDALGVATGAEAAAGARRRLRLRAATGEPRNDATLLVAQLHVALLRFHNATVDWLGACDSDPFAAARAEVAHTVQWLVLHDLLPNLCDPGVLADVVRGGAPLYAAFADGAAGPGLPLPIEVCAAALRFGHPLPCGIDDGAGGRAAKAMSAATLAQVFEFAGPAAAAFRGAPSLPDAWVVDWRRFVATKPARGARALDTALVAELGDLGADGPGMWRGRAADTLARGRGLGLPTAQGVLDALDRRGVVLPRLTAADLAATPIGACLMAEGLDHATPLWVYLLVEARGRGRLGPLGSRLVAETLVGLLVADPASVWHRRTAGGGPWAPQAVIGPGPGPVRSLADLLCAAGVL